MKKFRCPGCEDTVEALASTVWHRCPRLRNRPTWYDEITSQTQKES